MSLRLRIVYRSRPVQVPLLAAMRACGAWERAGLELEHAEYVSGSERSDPMLARGECHFIFGSHISPYVRRFRGEGFVYLGQSVNWVDDMIASARPLAGLRELEGKRLSESEGVSATGHHGSHPGGNHLLYLLRAGVELGAVSFIPSERRGRYRDVLEGRADAAFIPSRDARRVREAGLHVLRLDPLPMVHATTLTTLWPVLEREPELCEATLRAVLMGIHFIKTEPDRMWELMRGEVATELEIDDPERLEHLHRHNRDLLEPRLYPTPEAIANAFALAVMEEPRLRGALDPLSLWDLHLLRRIEESGFIRDLYGGQVPAAGRVHEP